jgi:hypothetical protein
VQEAACAPTAEEEFAEGTMFAKWDQLLYGEEDNTPSDVLLGELLLYYFEWFSALKESKASAQAVHGLLSMLLPRITMSPDGQP